MNQHRPMTPFDRFKTFLAQILTVTKEYIQKVEDEATDLAKSFGNPPSGLMHERRYCRHVDLRDV